MLTFAKLASLKFKPFDASDYMSFAGVESENPLIAEDSTETEYKFYIIDGNTLQIISGKFDDPNFGESCVSYSLKNEGFF